MNSLENFLFEGTELVPVKQSRYDHGAYLMLKHNTQDTESIIQESSKLYQLVYQYFKGAKLHPDSGKTTPRVPTDNYLKACIKKKIPMMVTSLELKSFQKGDVIISHHFIYGTNWFMETEVDDQELDTNLNSLVRNYLTTISKKGNNFLIQPVGMLEDQEVDRPTDRTVSSFIRCMDLAELYSTEDIEEEQDNLIVSFNKMRHPQMNFALYYSFVI